MSRLAPIVLASALLAVASAARAHESRPGYLELRETDAERYDVLWKQPARGDRVLRLNPILPETCSHAGLARQEHIPGALMTRSTVTCEGGLAGQTVRIAGLEATLTDVLMRVFHLDGASETHLLRPIAPAVAITGSSAEARAWSYLRLGVEHILMGADHLLFVLGLLLIVRDRWLLVKTVTAFTVAHSLTLGLATLGVARVPMPPLNAAIALSILFLGPEIVRAWRGETSLTIRDPWVVAFAFGLLHGFGFATGLTAMGLPSGEIPWALFLFNVGVELGQVAFVALVLLLERSFRTLEIVWPRWAQALPAYTVGAFGALWTIERGGAFLRSLRW